jgi:hypothetical protein
MYKGIIHAELDKARAEVNALADCLDGIDSPSRGLRDRETLWGLSLFVRHIAKDISDIQKEIEEAQ